MYFAVIIVGNTNDIQIAVAIEIDRTSAKMALFPGVNHVLRKGTGSIVQPGSYFQLTFVFCKDNICVTIAINIGNIHTICRTL